MSVDAQFGLQMPHQRLELLLCSENRSQQLGVKFALDGALGEESAAAKATKANGDGKQFLAPPHPDWLRIVRRSSVRFHGPPRRPSLREPVCPGSVMVKSGDEEDGNSSLRSDEYQDLI